MAKNCGWLEAVRTKLSAGEAAQENQVVLTLPLRPPDPNPDLGLRTSPHHGRGKVRRGNVLTLLMKRILTAAQTQDKTHPPAQDGGNRWPPPPPILSNHLPRPVCGCECVCTGRPANVFLKDAKRIFLDLKLEPKRFIE